MEFQHENFFKIRNHLIETIGTKLIVSSVLQMVQQTQITLSQIKIFFKNSTITRRNVHMAQRNDRQQVPIYLLLQQPKLFINDIKITNESTNDNAIIFNVAFWIDLINLPYLPQYTQQGRAVTYLHRFSRKLSETFQKEFVFLLPFTLASQYPTRFGKQALHKTCFVLCIEYFF